MKRAPLVLAMMFLAASFAAAEVPVFPGAEGFGVNMHPGRFGTVYVVDTVDDYGPNDPKILGSLRYGLEHAGEDLTIVFKVSGAIKLKDELWISKPDVYLAGQTAPYPGITLRDEGLRVAADNVIVQHLKVRPGDVPFDSNCDAITISSSNVVIDHCSFSWATDENVGLFGASELAPEINITISNCIIAEALEFSTNRSGNGTSYSALVPPYFTHVAFIKNFFIHGKRRNPFVSEGSEVLLFNNLVVGGLEQGILSWSGGSNDLSSLTAVANVFTPIQPLDNPTGISKGVMYLTATAPAAVGYAFDNIFLECEFGGCNDCSNNGIFREDPLNGTCATSPILSANNIDPWDVSTVAANIVNNVGAFPNERGPVDDRVISDYTDGNSETGKIIDCIQNGPLVLATGTIQSIQDPAPPQQPNYLINFTSATCLCQEGTGPNDPECWEDGYQIVILVAGNPILTDFIYHNTTECGTDGATIEIATVDPLWWNAIDPGMTTLRIEAPCANNLGGWPTILEGERAHAMPEVAHRYDLNEDGYTLLEEWLQYFPVDTDGTPPAITNVSVTRYAADAATVTWWTLGTPSYGRALYRTAGGVWNSIDEELQEPSQYHSVTVPDLQAGGLYEVIPFSKEDGGLPAYGPHTTAPTSVGANGLCTSDYWCNLGRPASAIGSKTSAPDADEDDEGGVVIVWADVDASAPSPGVYVQKLDANGVREWSDEGSRVSNYLPNGAPSVVRSVDGSLVAWIDDRTGSKRVYATRVDANGMASNPDGLQVLGDGDWSEVDMVTDNDDGAVVIAATSTSHIHAQRINQLAVTQWSDVLVTDNGTNAQVVPSSGNGAIVVWERDDPVNGGVDVFTRRVRAGSLQWSDEVELFGDFVSVSTGIQAVSYTIDELLDGVIVVAHNIADGLLTQRVKDDGTLMWSGGERILHDGAAGVARQENASIAFGNGWLTLVFEHTALTPGSETEIYAQRFDPLATSITTKWGAMGKSVSLGGRDVDAGNPRIIHANVDNVRCVWQETDQLSQMLFAQFLDENGDSRWQEDGFLQQTGNYISDLVTAGYASCGLFVAWREEGETGYTDGVFVNRLAMSIPPITPRHISLESGAAIVEDADCDLTSSSDVCFRLEDDGKSYSGTKQGPGTILTPFITQYARAGTNSLGFFASSTAGSGNQRVELTLNHDVPFYAERYVGFSMLARAATGLPTASTTLMNWWQDNDVAAPLALKLVNAGGGLGVEFQVSNGWTDQPCGTGDVQVIHASDIATEQWVDFVVGLRADPTGNGWVKIWCDGVLTDDNGDGYSYYGPLGAPNPFAPPNCQGQTFDCVEQSFYRHKFGIFREAQLTLLGVNFDEIRYGMTYGEVAPERVDITHLTISSEEVGSDWETTFSFNTSLPTTAKLRYGVHAEPTPTQCTSCDYTDEVNVTTETDQHTLVAGGLAAATSYCFKLEVAAEHSVNAVDTVFAPDTDALPIYGLNATFVPAACKVNVKWYTRSPSETNALFYRVSGASQWTELEVPNSCEIPRFFHSSFDAQPTNNYDVRVESVIDGQVHSSTTSAHAGRCEGPPIPGTVPAMVPDKVSLSSHPNPFNPTTTITFGVPARAEVHLAVYAVNGALVTTLAEGGYPPGMHSVTWNGKDSRGNTLATGIYFARIAVGKEVLTRKLVLLK